MLSPILKAAAKVKAMDDFRLVAGFQHHPKFVKLRGRLGAEGIVAFISLLSYATQYRSEGVLTDMEDADLALAAGWTGEPAVLIDMLVELRMLERGPDRVLSIHGWAEHQPFAVGAETRKSHARAAAQQRWNRFAERKRDAEVMQRASDEHETSNSLFGSDRSGSDRTVPDKSTPRGGGSASGVKRNGAKPPDTQAVIDAEIVKAEVERRGKE